MLTHDDSGEAVRIHLCLTFFIGGLIKLSERLSERLPQVSGENMLSPLAQLRRFRRERVPKSNVCRGGKFNDFSAKITDWAIATEAGTFPALLVAEDPD